MEVVIDAYFRSHRRPSIQVIFTRRGVQLVQIVLGHYTKAHTHIFSPFSNVPLLCLYRTAILVKSGHVSGPLATCVSRIGPCSPVAPPGWPSFGRPSRRPGICLPLSVRVAPKAPIILAEAATDADPILPQHIWKTKVTLEVLIFPWMICHHRSVP